MTEDSQAKTPAVEPAPAAFVIQTVCECQAALFAELDADRLVVRAWASSHGDEESAPANTVGGPAPRFDIAWQCPRCGRNTLRTFHEDALRRVTA